MLFNIQGQAAWSKGISHPPLLRQPQCHLHLLLHTLGLTKMKILVHHSNRLRRSTCLCTYRAWVGDFSFVLVILFSVCRRRIFLTFFFLTHQQFKTFFFGGGTTYTSQSSKPNKYVKQSSIIYALMRQSGMIVLDFDIYDGLITWDWQGS